MRSNELLAQAQKESERRQMKSLEFLAQAQKESEKRLMESLNLNNYKATALTLAGLAGLGSFCLFVFHSAGFKVFNPYLPGESK